MQAERDEAAAWFRTLRDRIVAAFEGLEDAGPGPAAPGRFELRETRRGADGGGGIMSVMRGGRVFEKVGVNWSAVHGELAPAAQTAMAARGVPGVAEDPRFWASGISLVAHMQNPHVPAVHMNTRMFWTPSAWWFGGGADLNPCLEYQGDTAHFHAALRGACDAHGADYYDRFKAWADEYFFIPHRGRARGDPALPLAVHPGTARSDAGRGRRHQGRGLGALACLPAAAMRRRRPAARPSARRS
ncbi:coproporphyrinogen III oxidase [Paracoccus mutanolyticus]